MVREPVTRVHNTMGPRLPRELATRCGRHIKSSCTTDTLSTPSQRVFDCRHMQPRPCTECSLIYKPTHLWNAKYIIWDARTCMQSSGMQNTLGRPDAMVYARPEGCSFFAAVYVQKFYSHLMKCCTQLRSSAYKTWLKVTIKACMVLLLPPCASECSCKHERMECCTMGDGRLLCRRPKGHVASFWCFKHAFPACKYPWMARNDLQIA